MGGLGDGIATLDGKPLFIPKSCPGDVLDIRVAHATHESLRGDIVTVITPGPHRVPAPCAHFADCGGCVMQQYSTPSYREFKQRVFDLALKQSGCAPPKAEVLFLPAASRRRVEMQLHQGEKGVSFAFYALRSHRLVPIEHCLIIEPALQALLAPLSQALGNLPGAKHIRSAAITAADSGIDVMLECHALPGETEIFAAMAKTLNLARIAARLPGGAYHTLCERIPVEMTLGNYPVALPYGAFLQASREGQAILTQAIVDGSEGAANIVDLFCGIGTYSFPLSRTAKVHAVDNDEAMINGLKRNIKRHDLSKKLSAERRDLFRLPLTAKELSGFDAAIVNPPRPGAKSQAEHIGQSAITRVVMVSCNPASFARDSAILREAGFTMTKAIGLDQFVYSPHLEIAAVFSR